MHSNFKPGHKQNIGNEVRFEVFIETSWSLLMNHVSVSCEMEVFISCSWLQIFLSLITTFSIICAKGNACQSLLAYCMRQIQQYLTIILSVALKL